MDKCTLMNPRLELICESFLMQHSKTLHPYWIDKLMPIQKLDLEGLYPKQRDHHELLRLLIMYLPQARSLFDCISIRGLLYIHH